MPLINLTTNLKNLGFGYDQPDGDSSKEPYIKVRIPATDEALQTGFSLSSDNIIESLGGIAAATTAGLLFSGLNPLGAVAGLGVGIAGAVAADDLQVGFKAPSAGTGGSDFLLRGGTLLPNRIARDVERIGKLVLDTKSFKGILFTIKQNILSRLAVKTEGTPQGILVNEGAYLPTSTLASVAGVALGGYFNKQGVNPFVGLGQSYVPRRYYDNVRKQLITGREKETFEGSGEVEITTNRLQTLYYVKILNNSDSSTNSITTENPNFLLSYRGGPGSVLGIGKTNIKIVDEFQRTGINNVNLSNEYFNLKANKKSHYLNITYPSHQENITTKPSINRYTGASNDYSMEFTLAGLASDRGASARDNQLLNIKSPAFGFDKENATLSTAKGKELYLTQTDNSVIDPDFSKVNKGSATVLANSYAQYYKLKLASETKDATAYGAVTYDVGPNINSGEYYSSPNTKDRALSVDKPIESDNYIKNNDLINFSIGIRKDSNTTDYYFFPAYITNLDDSLDADWKAEKMLGRGENFYTYNGFSRDINISFNTYARNPMAMFSMYDSLQKITAAITPRYLQNVFMTGVLTTLDVGDYLINQPGIITNFKFSKIISDDRNWIIDNDIALPYIFDISINFKPIYKTLPSINNPIFINPDLFK
jgi:hypothetical protein